MAGLAVEGEWGGDGLDHFFGDDARVGGLLQVAEDEGELVAADACGHVLVAHPLPEPVAHLAQQLVAGLVAEAVVDLFETVEVHEQQRHAGVAPPPLGKGEFEVLGEERAVGQAGDAVVVGQVGEPAFGALAFVDLALQLFVGLAQLLGALLNPLFEQLVGAVQLAVEGAQPDVGERQRRHDAAHLAHHVDRHQGADDDGDGAEDEHQAVGLLELGGGHLQGLAVVLLLQGDEAVDHPQGALLGGDRLA